MEATSHFVTLELKRNKVKIQVFGCFSHIAGTQQAHVNIEHFCHRG